MQIKYLLCFLFLTIFSSSKIFAAELPSLDGEWICENVIWSDGNKSKTRVLSIKGKNITEKTSFGTWEWKEVKLKPYFNYRFYYRDSSTSLILTPQPNNKILNMTIIQAVDKNYTASGNCLKLDK